LSEWAAQGLRPIAGRWKAAADAQSALLLPDGAGSDAFLVYANFAAIRRYNPSDFYALAVGLHLDRRAVLVGAADHEHLVARHPLVPGEHVGGQAEPGHVPDVPGAVGVRPGRRGENVAG